jgi:hypothetical protein
MKSAAETTIRVLAVMIDVASVAVSPAAASSAPSSATVVRALPGDYLTDLEKDYFQDKISTWAYYASPLFIGGNPATEKLGFWDRVDYELIFFPNMRESSYAMFKDVLVDSWRHPVLTWYDECYERGIKDVRTRSGRRNLVMGPLDGLVDGAHELFDAIKIFDGHWKIPFHPGCTTEGGTRFVSWVFNKGLVQRTKPVKPVYYALYPLGWIVELNAKGWNAGYLIGIKLCKYPPMLAEGLFFGGYDFITFRENRGAFRQRMLPFSWKSGCVLYTYEADMNHRRGPEKAPSKPPREVKPNWLSAFWAASNL